MTDEKPPILFEYFKSTADVLLAEYNRSKEQNASANLGRNREFFCNKFLEKVLPIKLSVRSGEIWDSDGHKTGQLDSIIIRDDAPILHIGSDDIYLAEGVFSVIEVKSNLTREKMNECGKAFEKADALKINQGASISSGPTIKRPLRIVFAYEGATWETILDEVNKNNWSELFDLICILDKGVLIKKGGLIEWEGDKNHFLVSGKPASLGYLYLYLVSYGTSFIGRSIALGPYFEPLAKWQEQQ